jgi:hypothetical protein
MLKFQVNDFTMAQKKMNKNLEILNQNHHRSNHFAQFNLINFIFAHFPIQFFFYLIIFEIFRKTIQFIKRLYIINVITMV